MTQPRPILDLAADLGIADPFVAPYGRDKAKISPALLQTPRTRPGRAKLVLVSAMTPTPAGEGKTTTSIGLGQALTRLDESVCLALREPSLGPCMGMKGGGTGGGQSQVVPSDDINLHFTGDFHAITAAHNLLAAALDNHLHFGNALDIDPRRVVWKRVIDMNDRSLRHVVTGLGGPFQGVPRESGFDITPASELMAMLCLAEDVDDLRERIGRTIVAYTRAKAPVTAGELKVAGAMLALLRDAMFPNLVQTSEGTPALLHGGPFANIAHGCNSVLATRTAMHLADWVVTEAGFGFDLGAEKFLNIKCVSAGLVPSAVVIVVTVRALKMHGGVPLTDLAQANPAAVARGLTNVGRHLDTAATFGVTPVVALNRFLTDNDEEINTVEGFCGARGVRFAVATHFKDGGNGAIALAEAVMDAASEEEIPSYQPLYDWREPVRDKICAVATRAYGARGVIYGKRAEIDLRRIERLGLEHLPVCMAKTQSSVSDNPRLLGRPTDFDITVSSIEINAGAGFLVVLTGDIMRMPGLPRSPQSERIDLVDGAIVGLR